MMIIWSQRWVCGRTWYYCSEDCPSGPRLHRNTHSHSSTKESVLAGSFYLTPTPSSTLLDTQLKSARIIRDAQMVKVPLFLSSPVHSLCLPTSVVIGKVVGPSGLFVRVWENTVGFPIKKPSGGPPPQSLSPQPSLSASFDYFALLFSLSVFVSNICDSSKHRRSNLLLNSAIFPLFLSFLSPRFICMAAVCCSSSVNHLSLTQSFSHFISFI